MKKISICLLVAILAISPILVKSIFAEEVSIDWRVGSKLIAVDGKKYKMDVAPMQEGSSTYIPLRVISEWMGFDVEWISEEKSVKLNNTDTQIQLWINDTKLIKNEQTHSLTISPIIKDSRTMISTNGLNLILDTSLAVDGKNVSMKVDSDHICYRWVDFEFPVHNDPSKTLKLSDYMNKSETKAVIVQIWYTECIPCHDQLEFLGELHRKYNNDGLEVLGVCTDGPNLEADREDLLDRLKVDFPICHDENYSTQATWFDPIFPNFFLLTPGEKCVTWFHERYSDEANEKLENMVKDLCGITD